MIETGVKMNVSVLVVLCLVTLSNVELGQSQCDGEVSHQNTVIQFHCKVCGCTHTVVRITAAVYEALKPILNEMREDISSVKSDIMVMKNEIATISGLNSRANMICDKIEEHDNHITTELIKINESLTEQIINNSVCYACGGTGNWRHAVYLDMTDPNNNCPSGWQLTGYSKRTCGRANSSHLSCDSVFFPVSGGPYSQVCGRIRAYQYGLPNAFYGYNRRGQATIDSVYVSGVAVMYGSPRQHIWTFACGVWENLTDLSSCPCDLSSSTSVPPFVGEDYFCESGYVHPGYRSDALALSGMGETVTPPVHVVLSTILHISPKPSARQLLMTWN